MKPSTKQYAVPDAIFMEKTYIGEMTSAFTYTNEIIFIHYISFFRPHVIVSQANFSRTCNC